MQQIAVMTEGFERAPFTDMMWSAPHIARHSSALLCRDLPMTTFEIRSKRANRSNCSATAARDPGRSGFRLAADPALRFKDAAGRRPHHPQRRIADNPMFVPPTAAEYLFQAGDMMWIIDKRISTVVYHWRPPAGAIIAIPDLNTAGEIDWRQVACRHRFASCSTRSATTARS